MNVLVVAPHPDDETIGCGGTIALLSAEGYRVVVAFLTSGERGLPEMAPDRARALREAEAEKAAATLGVADVVFLRQPDSQLALVAATAAAVLRRTVDDERPRRIYVPHSGEWHEDHAIAASIVSAAIEPEWREEIELLAYEVWTPLARPDEIEDISPVMDQKLTALRCYPSQLERFSYDDGVAGLNRYRGVFYGGCRFAEAFVWVSSSETSSTIKS